MSPIAFAQPAVAPQCEFGPLKGPPLDVCSECGIARGWSPDLNYLLLQTPPATGYGQTFVVDTAGGKPIPILTSERGHVWDPRFSPDGRWVSFMVSPQPQRGHIFVAPFRGKAPVPKSDWVEITPYDTVDDKARWTPDGRSLYFMSLRAGSMDIWVQDLDPTPKQPRGERRLVQRFPTLSRSLLTMRGQELSLGVAADRLVFLVNELAGSVFLLEPIKP